MLSRDPDNAPVKAMSSSCLPNSTTRISSITILPGQRQALRALYKKEQRILKANFLNIMFLRIPLLDPDAMLQRIMPLIKAVLSPVVALLWIGVVVAE